MIANKKKNSTCHSRGVYSLPPVLALEAKKIMYFLINWMNGEIGLRYFQRKQESSIPLNYYEKVAI